MVNVSPFTSPSTSRNGICASVGALSISPFAASKSAMSLLALFFSVLLATICDFMPLIFSLISFSSIDIVFFKLFLHFSRHKDIEHLLFGVSVKFIGAFLHTSRQVIHHCLARKVL